MESLTSLFVGEFPVHFSLCAVLSVSVTCASLCLDLLMIIVRVSTAVDLARLGYPCSFVEDCSAAVRFCILIFLAFSCF